jgi:UDP-2,3-diacylglucosamine pyrophosphatase LpxH
VPEAYRKIGSQLLESGFDMVVLAHTHFPEIIENSGKVYVNTGAWIKTYCYAELNQGELGLWEYLGPGKRRRIGNSFPLTD